MKSAADEARMVETPRESIFPTDSGNRNFRPWRTESLGTDERARDIERSLGVE
jgi:hypothetical protein